MDEGSPIIALFVIAEFPTPIINKILEQESETCHRATWIWLASKSEVPKNSGQPTITPIDPGWKSDFLGWTTQRCCDWMTENTPDYVNPTRFLFIDRSLRRGAIQFCINWTESQLYQIKESELDPDNPDHCDDDGEPDIDGVDIGIEEGLAWLPLNVGWAAAGVNGASEERIQSAFGGQGSMWLNNKPRKTWYADACLELGIEHGDKQAKASDSSDAATGQAAVLPSRPKS